MNFKQKHSVKIPHWFMQNEELTVGEKITILALYFFVDKKYKTDIFVKYIAELSSQSDLMTLNYLKKLEKKGYITIEKTKGPSSPKTKTLTSKGVKLIKGYLPK